MRRGNVLCHAQQPLASPPGSKPKQSLLWRWGKKQPAGAGLAPAGPRAAVAVLAPGSRLCHSRLFLNGLPQSLLRRKMCLCRWCRGERPHGPALESRVLPPGLQKLSLLAKLPKQAAAASAGKGRSGRFLESGDFSLSDSANLIKSKGFPRGFKRTPFRERFSGS